MKYLSFDRLGGFSSTPVRAARAPGLDVLASLAPGEVAELILLFAIADDKGQPESGDIDREYEPLKPAGQTKPFDKEEWLAQHR